MKASGPDAAAAPNTARRVAVGVSGSGRSLANFLKEQRSGGYEIAAVIASRLDCQAVEMAKRHGLPVFSGEFRAATLAAVGAQLYPWLQELGIAWIALAGFIKLFPIHPAWRNRVVNIHPALLPLFGGHGMYGDRVHAAVLAAGARESGASVHYVNERYDEGAVIAQITVPVLPQDTLRALADRVFAAESVLYPAALNKLLRGQLPLAGGRIERSNHA